MIRLALRRASVALVTGLLTSVVATVAPPVTARAAFPGSAAAFPGSAVTPAPDDEDPEVEPQPEVEAELDPLLVTIDRLSPSVVPTRGRVTMAGTIRNRSDTTWEALQVYMLRSVEPITGTEELGAAVAAPCVDVGTRIVDRFEEVPDLEPGERTTFRLSVPRGLLEISGAPGVYWFGVHVLGETDEGRVEGADGRACTFLPLVPARHEGTELALGLQVRNHVVRTADGRVDFLEGWHRSLSDGRLRRLLDLGTSAGPRPFTWLVDPAVVDAAADVARDNPQTDLAPPGGDADLDDEQGRGEAEQPADPDPGPADVPAEPETPESAAALAWVDELTEELTGESAMYLPYGDLDVAAAVRRGFPEHLELALDQSQAVMDDLAVSATPVLAPPSGAMPEEALAMVPAHVPIVLRPTSLPRAGAQTALDRSDGGRLLLAPDRTLLAGPGPEAPLTALAVRQRILADAALHALSADRGRPLIRLLPAGWDPGPEWRQARFFSGLDVPWLLGRDLEDALTGAVTGGVLPGNGTADRVAPDDLVYPASELTAELPFLVLAATDTFIRLGRTLDELLTQNDVIDDVLARQALLSSSVWSRPRRNIAAQQAQAGVDLVRGWLGRISVRGPAFVTMSSGEGTFQVTLVNGLNQPVTVGLRVSVPGQRLALSTPGPLDLPPRGRGAMRIDATATDIGIHLVTLQPVSDQGTPLGQPASVSIRSSRVGFILWIVMGAAGSLLFVLVAVRIVRRVRQRRRTHGPLLQAGRR